PIRRSTAASSFDWPWGAPARPMWTSTGPGPRSERPPADRARLVRRYPPGVSHRFALLVLGDANPDLILRVNVAPAFGQEERLVDEALLTVGGSGAIVACGAARLG